jgi:integrase
MGVTSLKQTGKPEISGIALDLPHVSSMGFIGQKQASKAATAAPAHLLELPEEWRMHLSDEQLIAEAIEVNHRKVSEKTQERYRDHLIHFSDYLASVHGIDFYGARRKHVALFMAHLEKKGGAKPHSARAGCSWCRTRGCPDGRSGPGWSPSYRKSYLSAIKHLYNHFLTEEDLPDINPAALVESPKVPTKHRYAPSQEEVDKLLSSSGTPRGRLLAHWMFFAPSRRKTYADARWRDIDLEAGTWKVVGKYEECDVFRLHPALVRALRLYRRWQEKEASQNDAMREALNDPESAFVLLTRNGKRTCPESIYKILRWHAVRAGVAVCDAKGRWDAPKGKSSRIHPHAMRRGWATIALNDGGVPIDVVSEVLHHKDISTTRRHYAPTKSDRADAALVGMKIKRNR